MNRNMEDDNRIFERAVGWLSALQEGEANPAALFAWLAESPRHVEEFTFALTLTDEIVGLTDEQCAQIAVLNSGHRAPQTIVPLKAVAVSSTARPAGGAVRVLRLSQRAAIAASLTLLVGLGGWVLQRAQGWQTYATAFGEQRVLELSDGSVVHLNTLSRVKVRYGDTSRDIQLLSGEALFKVERDLQHPFRVHTDTTVIQALGTQFNVHRRAHDATVAVLEGSVRISTQGESDASKVAAPTLAAGEEAVIAPKGAIATRPVDVAQVAAWRQQRLVFRNETLAEIAAEFNRYNRKPKIRIEDARAGARRFAATFDANAPEALLQVLATHPDLEIERGEREIVVHSRDATLK